MTKRHAINPAQLPAFLKAGKADADGKVTCHITDGGGLYIVVNPQARTGSWKRQYLNPTTGKRSKISLGDCYLAADGETVMGLGVAAAREEDGKVDNELALGLDPVAERAKRTAALEATHAAKVNLAKVNRERAASKRPPIDSFQDVAERWIDDLRANNAPSYSAERAKFLTLHAYPVFGAKHINEICEDDVRDMSEPLEQRGTVHALVKLRRFVKDVCDWAMHPKRKLRDPAKGNPVYREDKCLFENLDDAKHHVTILDPQVIRGLLLAIGNQQPSHVVRALQITMLTGQRSQTICTMERAHLSLDDAMPVWTIPPVLMKGRVTKKRRESAKPHKVFLSSQAVALLREQLAAAEGEQPGGRFVFPGEGRGTVAHITTAALRHRLYRMGYGDMQTVHGFRTMMRSCGEVYAKCDPFVLEHILAHKAATKLLEDNEAMARLQRARHGGMPGVYDQTANMLAHSLARRAQVTAQQWGNWLQRLVADNWTIELETASNDPILALAA